MANLAIEGHSTQGSEVIARLKMLGGMNTFNLNGSETNCYYYIDNNNRIYHCLGIDPRNYIYYTFEEFLEKFPYKVGDTVLYKPDNTPYFIIKMFWKNDKVLYELSDKINLEACSTSYTIIPDVDVVKLQPYKEETMEASEEFFNKYCVRCGSQRCTAEGEWLEGCKHYKEETMDKANKAVFDANAQCCDIMNHLIKEETIKIDIPKGYEFAGVDNDNQQVVFERIGCQYPKTHEECFNICFGNKHHIVQVVGLDDLGDNKELFESFIKLKICRDAYWKIAEDWKPDVMYGDLYCIGYDGNVITWKMQGGCRLLAFPTEEMRDAFYENFKELINDCKELL